MLCCGMATKETGVPKVRVRGGKLTVTLPARIREKIAVRDGTRVNRAFNKMKDALYLGHTAPLRGAYRGAYRCRVGSWLTLFTVKPDAETMITHDIRRRTSTRY